MFSLIDLNKRADFFCLEEKQEKKALMIFILIENHCYANNFSLKEKNNNKGKTNIFFSLKMISSLNFGKAAEAEIKTPFIHVRCIKIDFDTI